MNDVSLSIFTRFIMIGIGPICVLSGLLINVAAILKRERMPDNIILSFHEAQYGSLLAKSQLGHFIAFIGFLIFTAIIPSQNKWDYSLILNVLSLLSAGAIAGFYSFNYSNYAAADLPFVRRISICFQVLFYILFSSISFYLGKSQDVQKSEIGNVLIPSIMLVVLLANTYYDFLNYSSSKRRSPNQAL